MSGSESESESILKTGIFRYRKRYDRNGTKYRISYAYKNDRDKAIPTCYTEFIEVPTPVP